MQVLWKSYIDFEIEQEEYEKTRNLYRRLLQRTQHVKVCVGTQNTELVLNLVQGGEKALTALLAWIFQINGEPEFSPVPVP